MNEPPLPPDPRKCFYHLFKIFFPCNNWIYYVFIFIIDLGPKCAVCRCNGDDLYTLYVTSAPLDDDQADELRDTQRRLAEVAQERNDALQALQDVLAEVETEREEQW